MANYTKKHGQTNTRSYIAWKSMKQRCLYKGNKSYPDYGGRGITICEKWLDFAGFFEDMGQPAEGMSLDRINNEGNYEPSNCRWATNRENSQNRRSSMFLTINGKRAVASEHCRDFNLKTGTFFSRLRAGMTPEEALSKPVTTTYYSKKQKRKLSTLTKSKGDVNEK